MRQSLSSCHALPKPLASMARPNLAVVLARASRSMLTVQLNQGMYSVGARLFLVLAAVLRGEFVAQPIAKWTAIVMLNAVERETGGVSLGVTRSHISRNAFVFTDLGRSKRRRTRGLKRTADAARLCPSRSATRTTTVAKRNEATKRLREGLSLDQIARDMGVSFQAMSRYMKLQVAEGALKVSDVFFGIAVARREQTLG